MNVESQCVGLTAATGTENITHDLTGKIVTTQTTGNFLMSGLV
jgi:hypothetical protein